MKKPQGAGMPAASGPTQPPAVERRRRRWDPWIALPGGMWTGALRAFDVWLRLWEQIWAVAPAPARPRRGGEHERRHADNVPWVPQFEATVIPLRRRTDPPGAEATRLSMRLPMPPMPWSEGGANVISVETIIARRRQAAEEEGKTAEGRDENGKPPPAQD